MTVCDNTRQHPAVPGSTQHRGLGTGGFAKRLYSASYKSPSANPLNQRGGWGPIGPISIETEQIAIREVPNLSSKPARQSPKAHSAAESSIKGFLWRPDVLQW